MHPIFHQKYATNVLISLISSREWLSKSMRLRSFPKIARQINVRSKKNINSDD